MSIKFNDTVMEATNNEAGYMASFGVFSSSSTDPRNKLASTRTKIVDICADDAGTALSATAYRAARGRFLCTFAKSGDYSGFGVQGHYKNTAVDTSTGNKAGVWGYYEAGSAATVAANSAGVYAMIDVPSGATIGATCGALQCCSNDLGGTHTGKVAAIHVPNPVAGTFDFAEIYGTATGCVVANTANLGTNTLIGVKLVRFGSTTGYIPIMAAAPT